MPETFTILSRPITGISLGINFALSGDRFGHQIFARQDKDSDSLLLASLEGDNDSAWPPSPPLQDVYQQEINDQQVIMAVGMAGTSHWSASCSLVETETHVGFLFDMACRIKDTASWLGSRYQIAESFLGNHTWLIEPQEIEGTACSIRSTDENVVIEAVMANGEESSSPKSPSQTIRWQYLVKFGQNST